MNLVLLFIFTNLTRGFYHKFSLLSRDLYIICFKIRLIILLMLLLFEYDTHYYIVRINILFTLKLYTTIELFN